MNKKMASELDSIRRVCRMLPISLSEIVSHGFYASDSCNFLAILKTVDTNVCATDFPDMTGYECFINSLHIDDYTQENYLDCACFFVEELFVAWNRVNPNQAAVAIISMDELGVVVKFHTLRLGEFWVSDDLEGYEEAMLVAIHNPEAVSEPAPKRSQR